jgi:hypothetical protein
MSHKGYNVIVNGETRVCYPVNLGVNGSLFPAENAEDDTAFASAILGAMKHIQPFRGGWARPVGYGAAMELMEYGHVVNACKFPACQHHGIQTLQVVKNTHDTTY